MQLIRSGSTTFVEAGVSIGNAEMFTDIAGKHGARVYLGPGYFSA